MNSAAQTPMAKDEVCSGTPDMDARRKAWAPAKRQNTIQPFARRRAMPMDYQAEAASPESFIRSSRMPCAIRNASSSDWLAFRRGSQAVW